MTVSEARPIWVGQLPAVYALEPWGRMRLESLFKTMPEHPDSARLDAAFSEWGARSGLFANATAEELADTRMGHLLYSAAPETSLPVFWPMGIFGMWVIALDDYVIESGLPLNELKRACNDVIHSGTSSLPLTPGSRCFQELRRDVIALGGRELLPQIADEVQRLFVVNEKEQRYIADDTLPSLTEYLRMRAVSMAFHGMLQVQRCEDGLLPPHRHLCERLSWLADLANLVSGLNNDILGYRRDIYVSYPMNIIPVLSLQFRVDLATAYLMSLDLIELLKHFFDVLVEDVVTDPGPYPEAAAQARAFAYWPDGFHTWHQRSRRFGTDQPAEPLEPTPLYEDFRSGPLLRALTGRDHFVDADAADTDWRRGAIDAITRLFGSPPLWGSTPSTVAAPLAPEPEPEPEPESEPSELPEFPPSLTVRWKPHGAWVCEPRDTAEVVTLANWARAQGFQLRPSDNTSFTPPTGEADAQRFVLVDTRAHLNEVRMVSTDPAAVRAGVGATVEALLSYLEKQGYGLATAPQIGELTLGGALATGSHGSSVEIPGEIAPYGHNHGLLSNLVVSLTAVVWDAARGEYVAQTFDRAHPDCAALLVNLGRSFVTEATLRVGANQLLRCVSDVSSPATEVFGPAELPSPRRFASLMHLQGRVEVRWFPYSDRTWVRTWTPALGPSCARPVDAPYNYPFMGSVPEQTSNVVGQIMNGAPELAPALSDLEYGTIVSGLASSASADLVGLSKNVLLDQRADSSPYVVGGYAICTRRADLQRVVYDFTEFYRTRLREYQEQGQFPVNGPLHIRASSIDNVNGLELPDARTPLLSPIAPNSSQPDWDVAVWIELLNLPGTPYANQFYRELEEFLFSHFCPPYAMPRIEWSKAWGYTDEGPYRDRGVVGDSYGDSLAAASSTLSSHDPHGVFSNDSLDHIFSSA